MIAPTIDIYCDDMHPENPYSIARFARTAKGWELLAPWLHAEVDDTDPRTRRQREDIAVRVSGRVRYNLACDVCRYTVPVRDDRLQPILEIVHEAGLSSLSLRHLSARLRRSGMR